MRVFNECARATVTGPALAKERTTMMTPEQKHKLAAALDRARESGCRVLATGARTEGVRFIAVSSSGNDAAAYLLVIEEGRLICPCKGGRHLCKHRAVAHAWLVAEATKARQIAAKVAPVQSSVPAPKPAKPAPIQPAQR